MAKNTRQISIIYHIYTRNSHQICKTYKIYLTPASLWELCHVAVYIWGWSTLPNAHICLSSLKGFHKISNNLSTSKPQNKIQPQKKRSPGWRKTQHQIRDPRYNVQRSENQTDVVGLTTDSHDMRIWCCLNPLDVI